MRQISFLVLIGATMLLSAFTISSSIEWKITDDYSVNFKGEGVEGIFKTMSGEISFNENEPTNSKFSISIDVASINTGNGIMNKHAKNEKWFDAKQYPAITFISNKISKANSGYQVEGTLVMHGTKKQMTIPFTFSSNTFKGSFSVNRMDYGIGSLEGMSKKVSNKINLEIIVPVTKK
jgi:polyisoprenoid-binding protein YceI